MENSTYIALSGENARQQQMDVLSNNIANMSTPGFKAERTMFQEHMVKAQNGQNAGGSDFVDIIGNARDMSQGPISQTGNPLDVALNGEGFIPVTTPNGTEYTRDGHLSMDAQGELTTSTGLVLQGDGGAPIVVPSGSGQISIARDGTISTQQGTVGKFSVVNFANPQVMNELQGGLYTTDQTATPATGTTVEQGSIEGANVQPIYEMTKLMDASRQLTNAKNFTDGEHNRLKNAIDRLGKTV